VRRSGSQLPGRRKLFEKSVPDLGNCAISIGIHGGGWTTAYKRYAAARSPPVARRGVPRAITRSRRRQNAEQTRASSLLLRYTYELRPMSNKPVTLINVFTVEPLRQQELVALLARATEGSVRHAAGFVSARLHRSLDGTKVTMYAQWRSAEDYQAMRADPTPLPYLQQALAIARFEPGIYEVVQTFFPADGDAW